VPAGAAVHPYRKRKLGKQALQENKRGLFADDTAGFMSFGNESINV
jgi:hypothetical protein